MPASAENAHNLLGWARRTLQAADLDDALLLARLLLAHVLGLTRSELLRRGDVLVDGADAEMFREMVVLKAQRVPLAYLTGRREFYGRVFDVTPEVLIPRQETEMLVELAIERMKPGAILVDVGTGSGCIAVSAVAEGWSLAVATDVSRPALRVARRNAASHGVADRVATVRADLLSGIADGAADLVVSNPPYVPSPDIEGLQPEVKDHEPRGALDGGPDGLDIYRRLLPEARRVLRPRGMLAVEVGVGQAQAVSGLMGALGYTGIAVRRDLAGIERVVAGVWIA